MTTSQIDAQDWKAHALTALDAAEVWSVYTHSVYEESEKSVFDDRRISLDGSLAANGQPRMVPAIGDPAPLLLHRLWAAGQHRGAVGLITGLWLRVRQRQQAQGLPLWPVEDLLDALRYHLVSEWSEDEHRAFSEMFWERSASRVLGGQLAHDC